MKPIHSIFYSWQSDLPNETNLLAIRQAIRDASSLVESEIDVTRIEIDEATRDTTGSPNIPKSIFDKILVSDIFICDLSTINTNAAPEFRRAPNPNVLVELGFAIATLGWERIIMVFNTNHGKFPEDLPFDIDRHRGTPFAIKDKKDNNGKKSLSQVLKIAIQAIIEKSPLKPHEKRTKTPQERKRDVDISNLKWVLSVIHIPTFDSFLEEMPERIDSNIFYLKDCYVGILNSSIFHIYDKDLLKLLLKFKENLETSLSYGEHYGSDGSGKGYVFYLPMDEFPSERARTDFQTLIKTRLELAQTFRDLLLYVRDKYLEINVEEESAKAFESYISSK